MANETDDGSENNTSESSLLDSPDFNNKLNAAISGHLKRSMGTLEKMLEEKLSKISQTKEPTEDPEAEPSDKSKPVDETTARLAKLEKQLNEERKLRKLREREALQTKLNAEIQSALRGKVSDDWISEATERVARMARIDDAGASLVIDDLPHSIGEGVDAWLKDPSNKKFLPAPKTPVGQRASAPIPNPTGPDGKPRQLSIDEKAALLAAEGWSFES